MWPERCPLTVRLGPGDLNDKGVPEDWAWWLRNFRAHDSCIGWPVVEAARKELELA